MPKSGKNHIQEFICSQCSTTFTLRRKPDAGRPVLCKKCIYGLAVNRARRQQYYKRPGYKTYNRTWRLKSYYGMSLEDYNHIIEAQGGVCAICKKSPKTAVDKLVVDHDHKTQKVRGLLCQNCNRAIGTLGDNLTCLRQAASYLLRTDPRRSWDEYFIEFARLAATRSKDPSSQVGAVLVRNKVILSTGYNGFPRGVNDNILERYQRPQKYAWTIHGEENSILNAAREGIKINQATLYVTPFSPCSRCAVSIINAGIREVVVDTQFDNPRFAKDFEEAAFIFSAGKVLVRGVEN